MQETQIAGVKEEVEILGTDIFERKILSKCKFCDELFDVFAERASVMSAATIDDILDSNDNEITSENEGIAAYNAVMSTNNSGELYEDNEVVNREAK